MLSIPTLPGPSLNRRRDFDRNPQVAAQVESLDPIVTPSNSALVSLQGAEAQPESVAKKAPAGGSVNLRSNGVLDIVGLSTKPNTLDVTYNPASTSNPSPTYTVVLNGNIKIFDAAGVKSINAIGGKKIDTQFFQVPVDVTTDTGNLNDSVKITQVKVAGSTHIPQNRILLGKGRDVVTVSQGGVNYIDFGGNKSKGDGVNDNAFVNIGDTVVNRSKNDTVQFNKPVIDPVDPVDPVTVDEILYIDGNLAPDPFEVLFQGDTLSLQRSSIATEDGGVFYRAILNGVDRGDFRANGKIIIQVPGGENGGNVIIDPALKTYLESQEPHPEQGPGGRGWLEFKGIDSTALPALPQSFFSTLDILMSTNSLLN